LKVVTLKNHIEQKTIYYSQVSTENKYVFNSL